jgi:hypothetical protein
METRSVLLQVEALSVCTTPHHISAKVNQIGETTTPNKPTPAEWNAAKDLTPLDQSGPYDASRILGEADWEIQPASGRLPARMRVNPQAMSAIASLRGLPKGTVGLEMEGNAALSLAEVMRLRGERGALRKEIDVQDSAHIQRIATALDEAAKLAGNGSLILYRTDRSLSRGGRGPGGA